jgi:hypothetical protein
MDWIAIVAAVKVLMTTTNALSVTPSPEGLDIGLPRKGNVLALASVPTNGAAGSGNGRSVVLVAIHSAAPRDPS